MKFLFAPLAAALTLLASVAFGQEGDIPHAKGEVKSALIKGDAGYEFVSYQLVNGFAVVNGDIVAGSEDDFKAKIITDWSLINVTASAEVPGPRPDTMRFGKRAHSVKRFDAKLWPNAHVFYKYKTQAAKKAIGNTVEIATSFWSYRIGCLKFTELPVSADLTPDAVTIDNTDTGCYASVGKGTGGGLNMNLGAGCGDAQALHEFGHVLGLYHEQKRYDRDSYTTFTCSNLNDVRISPIAPQMT